MGGLLLGLCPVQLAQNVPYKYVVVTNVLNALLRVHVHRRVQYPYLLKFVDADVTLDVAYVYV